MNSILKKEFKAILPGIFSFLLLTFIIFSTGHIEQRYDLLIFLVLLALLPFINIIDKDNASGWSSFSLALPIKRKDIVRAKYTLALCIALFTGIFLVFWGFAGSMASGSNTEPSAIIAVAMIAYLTAVVSLSISLPAAIGMGIKSAAAMFFLLFTVIYLMFTLQAKILNPAAVPYQGYPMTFYISVFIMSIAIMFISYLVTCHLFEKRDF